MDGSITLLVLTLAFLFLLSGTFSGSETALFSLDRLLLRRFERSASRRERLIAAVTARPERLLAGILFGNTLVNVASSSVAVAIAQRLGGALNEERLVAVAVLADTGLLLVLGEILPKGLAVQFPAAVARVAIPVLDPLLRTIRPAAHLLERAAEGVLRAVGVRADGPRSGFTRPELQLLFEDVQGEKEGFTKDESVIAANIFDFFETRAWEIMTPRVDVDGVPVDMPREAIRDRAMKVRRSRLPVYRGSLDHVIGFISTREFLLDPDLPMERLLKPVHFVPERARVHGILTEMQARRRGMVIVVNEHGGTSGVITLEDLVEEIVGEIFDEQERDQEPEVLQVGDTTWKVDGLVTLEDLGDALGVPVQPGPAPTVAGHIAHCLGRPPRVGDAVRDGRLEYRVLQVRRHRARRVEVEIADAQVGPGGDPA